MNLRIAEVCYKLNNIDESFKTIAKVENDMKPQDKYMLHLLKGKCFDKIKQFRQGVAEYKKALELAQTNGQEDDIVGQIEFRLGWSIVRSKLDIQSGIEHLSRSNQLIPGNTEVMIKLAGVLFQERGEEPDIQKSKELLIKAIELEPNNAEALLLQGKIYHKLGEW